MTRKMQCALTCLVCSLAAAMMPGPSMAAGSSGPSASPVLPESAIAAQFRSAFTALGPSANDWEIQVSPAMPAHWPGARSLIFYAYAYRQEIHLADGVRIAAPWARGEMRPGQPFNVTLLHGPLMPIGIQGVRPMMPQDGDPAQRQAQVQALLTTPATAQGDRLIRAYYCGWRARQGVIAASIEPLHPDFFSWLRCDG
jgi:hypothetical protein